MEEPQRGGSWMMPSEDVSEDECIQASYGAVESNEPEQDEDCEMGCVTGEEEDEVAREGKSFASLLGRVVGRLTLRGLDTKHRIGALVVTLLLYLGAQLLLETAQQGRGQYTAQARRVGSCMGRLNACVWGAAAGEGGGDCKQALTGCRALLVRGKGGCEEQRAECKRHGSRARAAASREAHASACAGALAACESDSGRSFLARVASWVGLLATWAFLGGAASARQDRRGLRNQRYRSRARRNRRRRRS